VPAKTGERRERGEERRETIKGRRVGERKEEEEGERVPDEKGK